MDQKLNVMGVSKSVLSRWSYPLVPDETLPGSHERYEQRRNRMYFGQRLKLSRSCTVGSVTIIGHGTTIADHSNVSHSIIGQDCKIAANAVIVGSFIHSGAAIGDGCIIRDSIIGEGAKVKAGAVISESCLVGPGVTIGEAAKLYGRRVSVEPFNEAESANGIDGKQFCLIDYDSADTLLAIAIGTSGEGHLWPSETEVSAVELDSDDEDALDPRNLRISQLKIGPEAGEMSSSSSASTISRSSSSDSLASNISATSSRASGMTDPPAIAGIGALSSGIETDNAAFERECRTSLDRSFEEGHTVENASIELKTLRMATNVTMKQVTGVAVSYMCERIEAGPTASAAQVAASVDELVERWGGLITSLTGTSQSGMVEALLFLQEHCATTKDVHPRLFPAFLQAYYQEDVISEEAIRSWVTSPAAKNTGGEAGQKLWQIGAAFMRALMEADDDDEESDE